MKEILESLLGSKIVLCQSVRGGRNSRVFKIEDARAQVFIGKFYYQDKNDGRDRLGTEYTSLQFLWQQGVRCVPQPLLNDPQNHCAIYQYIEGQGFSGQHITRADMDQVLAFVQRLQAVKKDVPPGFFKDASEACFSLEQLGAHLEGRRRRLDNIDHAGLKDFLKDFDAFWKELLPYTSSKQVLPLDKRTLSPSDFGFHNALKKGGGKIVFLDFEYFGWDDPAKMMADFILHPAMQLDEETRAYFIQGMHTIFAADSALNARLKTVYPFFGMKWCLILLNEFLSQDFSRRVFADDTIDREKVLTEQLLKADNMLNRIKNTYQDNSYAK
jgi:thiamine kinase-like enzyme